jgi:hypothetical protein
MIERLIRVVPEWMLLILIGKAFGTLLFIP